MAGTMENMGFPTMENPATDVPVHVPSQSAANRATHFFTYQSECTSGVKDLQYKTTITTKDIYIISSRGSTAGAAGTKNGIEKVDSQTINAN